MAEFRPYIKWTVLRVLGILLAFGICSLSIWKFNDQPSQAWQTLCAGFIAAGVAGTWNIYDINSWSLRKRTLVHSFYMALVIFPTLFISGWFSFSLANIALAVGIFILTGCIAWTIGYIFFRGKDT
ncbi:DUF3021 family protein [Streptococcus minor]|uniref:DUF3021 family protein n=1 Tax=Streptococcus minor TaxID=229549 RepID=UPI0003742193|nr:DUF3021 family protein [Streptococcus minor]